MTLKTSIIAPGREGSQLGGAQENPALCGGAFLRCFLCVWSFATGVATRPRHLFPPINPSLTGRAACCIAKACAQCSAGVKPSRRNTKARTSGHMAGLGTAARGANLYSSLFRHRSESASIIAPGREGSQSGGADAYLGARLFCKIGVCYSSRTRLEIEQ